MLSYMPVISAVGDVAGNLWVTLTEGWRGHGRVAGTSRTGSCKRVDEVVMSHREGMWGKKCPGGG